MVRAESSRVVARVPFVLLCILCLLGPGAARAQDEVASSSVPLTVGETFTMKSHALSEVRRINVFRPTFWGEEIAGALPILVMPDGGIDEDFLHVAGLLQVSVSNGTMRPFLLVGIENTERRRDLTGPTENEQDKTIAPRVGGSAAFRAFLRDELLPEVRRRYAVTDETAIVGESLAGLFAVECFLLEPDLFDTCIAIDPSLWWNDGALVEHAATAVHEVDRHGTALFMATSGQGGMAEPAARLVAALESAGIGDPRVVLEPMPEETHASIYHPAAVKAFRRMFPPPVNESEH